MSETTEAQQRFQRILRERARMEDEAAAMPAEMRGYRVHDPEAGARLRAAADGFREMLSAVELESLETWSDEYMQQIATSIAHGRGFREGFG